MPPRDGQRDDRRDHAGPRDPRHARALPAPGRRARRRADRRTAGSQVTARLPLAPTEGAAREHVTSTSAPIKVLLVDDEGLVRSGFRLLLDCRGRHRGGRRSHQRRRGRRAGPSHPARRRTHGHPDAEAGRHRGHQADRHDARTRARPHPHPDHVRHRRVRLRGTAGRRQRVPAQGRRPGRAPARHPRGRRRETRCSHRGSPAASSPSSPPNGPPARRPRTGSPCSPNASEKSWPWSVRA